MMGLGGKTKVGVKKGKLEGGAGTEPRPMPFSYYDSGDAWP